MVADNTDATLGVVRGDTRQICIDGDWFVLRSGPKGRGWYNDEHRWFLSNTGVRYRLAHPAVTVEPGNPPSAAVRSRGVPTSKTSPHEHSKLSQSSLGERGPIPDRREDPPEDEILLRLDEGAQLALAASLLCLMNFDIDGTPAGKDRDKKCATRNRYRALLATGPLGFNKASTGELSIEALDPGIRHLLSAVTNPRYGLVILVELLTAEPWVEQKAPVDSSIRRLAVSQVAQRLGCSGVSKATGASLESHLELALKAGQPALTRMVKVVGIGLVLGIATAGLAAPAIGAAIGGTMGLSGAAATSAGLAFMGGGSIAAGGLGMAGGTAVLTGIGGITGAAAIGGGALAGGVQVEAEWLKLFVLTRCFRSRSDCSRQAVACEEAFRDQSRQLNEFIVAETLKEDKLRNSRALKAAERRRELLERLLRMLSK